MAVEVEFGVCMGVTFVPFCEGTKAEETSKVSKEFRLIFSNKNLTIR